MKPVGLRSDSTEDLFRHRLENMLDMRHELIRLSKLLPWDTLTEEFGALYSEMQGRPGKPIRLMAGLLLLQHTYNLSDEEVVMRWRENPYWQYFCGFEYFQHNFPIDPTSLIKWRKRIGGEGCEKILALTVQAGIELRQTYKRKAKALALQISRYAHANQFKRMRKSLRTLKCLVGRVYRDIQRKASDLNKEELSSPLLFLVERLLSQTKETKDKLYSLHSPEVECVAKGKSHKRYEFGNKVAFTIPLKKAFIVGVNSFQGNPYDGHTLENSLQKVYHLTGIKVEQAFVDQGYKGHGVQEAEVFLSRQKRGVTKTLKRHLKRRQSIEPVIGHMKQDGKLGHNYLKGVRGNEINAALSGVGFNIRTILNKINFILQNFLSAFLRILPSFKGPGSKMAA